MHFRMIEREKSALYRVLYIYLPNINTADVSSGVVKASYLLWPGGDVCHSWPKSDFTNKHILSVSWGF